MIVEVVVAISEVVIGVSAIVVVVVEVVVVTVVLEVPENKQYNSQNSIQGVKVYSGKFLSSKFGRIQCLYCNKQYISIKPLSSALISHLESDCSSKIVS